MRSRKTSTQVRLLLALPLLLVALHHTGCFGEETPQTYYGTVAPPRAQEFRWSDGGLPQIFDPAFAAAPPDTDLIRAIFEGLTEYDPRTLQPVPAVATHWESSKDAREWTFYLRQDARWSNGEPVTAQDFVQSWERTIRLGRLAPHTELLRNIEGALTSAQPQTEPSGAANSTTPAEQPAKPEAVTPAPRLGTEAVGDHVLKVRLLQPDENFPALVAHPVFRPVKQSSASLARIGPTDLVSNGAFLLAKAAGDEVLLERAQNYWGKQDVSLERVKFIDSSNAEDALSDYRAGTVDAVTNAAFEPLVIKLLAPYQDFRRATYGAVIYYSFNTEREPFNDVRVREAFAIAIDRERISQDDLGGATEPAKKFLPAQIGSARGPVVGKSDLLEKDIARARSLLADAGFPDGNGFPRVRLLIVRNEQQRLVAESIAEMWRTALNVETEIVMKSWEEYEATMRAGEYEIVRRGLVMQTTDELTNMRMMFRHESFVTTDEGDGTQNNVAGENETTAAAIVSEEQALQELRAFPIYFASSYALVKPYVIGFDSNILDAPSLKTVKLDTVWTEKR